MSAQELLQTLRPAFTASTPSARLEMGLAGAGWTDQVDGLGAIDELQSGERHDAVLVERGLERRSRSRRRF